MKKVVFLFALVLFSGSLLASDSPLWMRYPSISPDGKTIVFSYQGDLFTVPVEGGKAKHLTTNPSHDYKAVWSPDGKTIAFASNRYGNFDIYIIDAKGGKPLRITNHSSNEYPSSFNTEGTEVLYSSTIQDKASSVQFPYGRLGELYSVNINNKGVKQLLSTTANGARYNSNSSKILYYDSKGYEDEWRKHHTSSITRDIWEFDTNTGKHTKLTSFEGEDRDAIYLPGDDSQILYLSEKFGTFNVCKISLNNPTEVEQVTKFEIHPVRFLTSSQDATLCFGFNGEIYIAKKGEEAQKVNIEISIDDLAKDVDYQKLNDVSEMQVSPSGDEVLFISRGEVFVTSTDYKTTKRITNTPEQERSASFSPDGKSILYASERNGSWNLYQTKLVREEEKSFASSTILQEEEVLISEKETFQPSYSPDGKEVAFLEDRVNLKVINLKNKKVRSILEGYNTYSYSDGDQYYQWSPDGKWFLASYSPNSIFMEDIALVSAEGNGEVRNLTNSGYNDGGAKWMLKGNMMIWFSDKQGYRSHGSWGSHSDVYGMFFNKKSFDKFNMTKEEIEALENESKDKKDKKKDDKKIEDIEFDWDNLDERTVKLTINSSSLADAVLSPKGDKLYYLSRFEKGADLWERDFRENTTKLLIKLKGRNGELFLADEGKKLFVFSERSMYKIETAKKSKEAISFDADINLNLKAEKAYMFEHVWRQVDKKFYVSDLHGVDWNLMKENYSKFLPHINNNFDYSEMMSEMLGELNGSHTGMRYRPRVKGADNVSSLGILWDWTPNTKGIRVEEILAKGPFDNSKSDLDSGSIITKINGVDVKGFYSLFAALNHMEGKNILVSFETSKGKSKEEVIKPISNGAQNNLLYKRWIKARAEEVEKLSGGKIGYIHVRGMNSGSYRDFYSDLLGKNYHKDAVIIDTRFNGGGWLHDDLATTLNGKQYVRFNIRGKFYGKEPLTKWTKPSAVLMGEGNYSDAHGFPFTYKALGVGKLIGMPVPGTMTAVWWESLQDNSLVFGIPQVGTMDNDGNYLENQQLEPDVKVSQDYDVVIQGRDQQIEKAVEELMK